MESIDELLVKAEAAHGHLCAGQILGVRMALLGLERLGIADPRGADRNQRSQCPGGQQEADQSETAFYLCPIFSSAEPHHDELVGFIRLPAGPRGAVFWSLRRVYAFCGAPSKARSTFF